MRSLAVVLLVGALVSAGCGSSGGGATIVTVGALNLDLPITVPSDIPAPSNGEYAGENEQAAPYRAVQVGSDFDSEELRAAVRDFAESVGANYDESIEQALYTTTIDGVDQGVYVSVRTTDVGPYPTLLEIGTVDVE